MVLMIVCKHYLNNLDLEIQIFAIYYYSTKEQD